MYVNLNKEGLFKCWNCYFIFFWQLGTLLAGNNLASVNNLRPFFLLRQSNMPKNDEMNVCLTTLIFEWPYSSWLCQVFILLFGSSGPTPISKSVSPWLHLLNSHGVIFCFKWVWHHLFSLRIMVSLVWYGKLTRGGQKWTHFWSLFLRPLISFVVKVLPF